MKLPASHVRLEELIVQFPDAPLDHAAPALEALRIHAERHLAVEDLELRAMKDGNTKCHLDEHAAVLKSLNEVKAVLTQDGVGADSKGSLAAQLLSWLPEHVHEMDAGVATYRSKQRFGGAPVKIARRQLG